MLSWAASSLPLLNAWFLGSEKNPLKVCICHPLIQCSHSCHNPPPLLSFLKLQEWCLHRSGCKWNKVAIKSLLLCLKKEISRPVVLCSMRKRLLSKLSHLNPLWFSLFFGLADLLNLLPLPCLHAVSWLPIRYYKFLLIERAVSQLCTDSAAPSLWSSELQVWTHKKLVLSCSPKKGKG